MSSRKINIKNSSFCKKDLFNVLDFVYLAIYFYRNCAISYKICCINNNFEKYIEYMQSNCNYNLTILFISIKQVYKK